MIKKVYNYSNGEKEDAAIALRDLLAVVNRQQWVRLWVLPPSENGLALYAARSFEGDVEDETFLESIGKFLDCPVRNVASGSANGGPSLHITIHCDNHAAFDLEEHLNEFSDDFLTKYN